MMKNHLMSRLISIGLTAILRGLTAFSIWATLTIQQAASRTAVTEYLNDQYQQARFAVGAEESLERMYRLEPGPEPLANHTAWIWIPLVLSVISAGLFLPAWVPFLLAVIENIIIFWYLLVEHHTQMTLLMSPEMQAQLLLYICLLLYATATVAAVYAVTTKKAVIQADRAAELEQANAAQEQTHAALVDAYARVEQLATTYALRIG